MPTLFNTIDSGLSTEVKTYNFISNQFFAGVPYGSLDDHNGTPGNFSGLGFSDWVTGTALPTSSLSASDRLFFYFPGVVGEPCNNETLSSISSTTYRIFNWFYGKDMQCPINNTRIYNTLSTLPDGSDTNHIDFPYLNVLGSNSNISTNLNYFTFAAKSNTTLTYCGFVTPTDIGGDNLTSSVRSFIIINGWMHEGIFDFNPVDESTRFNQIYTLGFSRDNNLFVSSFLGGSPKTINSNIKLEFFNSYYDIECLNGNYSPGLFFTDLVLIESGTGRKIGKVDNRVVCIGRGTFEIGKVYRGTDIFGRTGTEDWLCVCPYYNSSYTQGSYNIGNYNSNGGMWKVNELDFVLIRIYTEAD